MLGGVVLFTVALGLLLGALPASWQPAPWTPPQVSVEAQARMEEDGRRFARYAERLLECFDRRSRAAPAAATREEEERRAAEIGEACAQEEADRQRVRYAERLLACAARAEAGRSPTEVAARCAAEVAKVAEWE